MRYLDADISGEITSAHRNSQAWISAGSTRNRLNFKFIWSFIPEL